eukprot:TRINITY_DN4215_c0_g1_i1.p1 TRINITY_DN4215_c0_g1~~TRINITY_DN4215_c0_g1_i1.p1  ORF type:complete len:964 (-),score=265.67 TRINITY_DN4215_c0_g1_i1:44-2935(-)
MDQFRIECVDLGELSRIQIGHDGSGPMSGWFLDKVVIRAGDGTSWFFICGRWLASDEDDKKIVRELPAQKEDAIASLPLVNYKVTVLTGDRRGAGTDANVSITLYGEHGDSGSHKLENNQNNFERNKTDVFSLDCVSLGNLTKIRIGHDDSGIGSGWFLDKVIVFDGKSKQDFYFLCGKWLAKDEDDKQIIREIPASNKDGVASAPLSLYEVSVVTGDRRYAGTDANVFFTMYGAAGDSGVRKLNNPKNSQNMFERGQTDVFGIECVELGDLSKIRIGHDNSGVGSGWFLDKIIVKNLRTSKNYYFLCGKWLDDKEDDKQLIREIPAQTEDGRSCLPIVNYKVTIRTADFRGAGTDANVFVHIYGKNGSSGDRVLDGEFERGSVDTFGIECVDLGPIEKLRIGHDNRGFGPGWFLDKVTIRNESTSQEYYFLAGRWLDKSEGDGLTVIEMTPKNEDGVATIPLITYKVTIKTADRRGAGTDARVFVCLYGDKGKTGDKVLDAAKDAFEKGKVSVFGIDSLDLGVVNKIRIGHDGSGFAAGWFLDKVTVRNEKTGEEWFFICGRWLASDEDDGQIVREISSSMEDGQGVLPLLPYRITVSTADRRGAGTSADVFIVVYGDKGDSGQQTLEAKGAFKRGTVDTFGIECVELGNLTKIRIGHNDGGLTPGWYLDKVSITNDKSGKTWYFLCGQWLDKHEGDKKIVREIPAQDADGVAVLPMTTYKIVTVTGDISGAGSDADVFIQLFGDKGDSGVQQFDAKRSAFERGKEDVFGLELVELGDIKKIRIGHDNSGVGSGWFLDKVTVSNLTTGQQWFFPCGRWLDKDEDDKQIERELFPGQGSGKVSDVVAYEAKISTGDVSQGGTDAHVFLTVFGTKGSTAKLDLKGEFERGKTDLCKFEAMDLGPLTKIRIGHDNSGIGASWFLDKVVIRNVRTNDTFTFTYNQWLSKSKGDGRLVAEISVSSTK